MAIRAVVFDLFDTLVDLRFEDVPLREHEGRTVPASLDPLHAVLSECAEVPFGRFLEVMQEVDQDLRKSRYAEGRELPTEERFEAVLERLAVDAPHLPAALADVHMGVLRSVVTVPDHHEDLLGQLRERVPLALCSNFTHSDTALRVLDEAGFRPHLDAIAVSDAVGWRKPRAEIFESVLRELDLPAEDVLHVGDNLRADVAGADAVGMRSAWVTRRVGDPEQKLEAHDGPPPEFVIHDLAEIGGILDGRIRGEKP